MVFLNFFITNNFIVFDFKGKITQISLIKDNISRAYGKLRPNILEVAIENFGTRNTNSQVVRKIPWFY